MKVDLITGNMDEYEIEEFNLRLLELIKECNLKTFEIKLSSKKQEITGIIVANKKGENNETI